MRVTLLTILTKRESHWEFFLTSLRDMWRAGTQEFPPIRMQQSSSKNFPPNCPSWNRARNTPCWSRTCTEKRDNTREYFPLNRNYHGSSLHVVCYSSYAQFGVCEPQRTNYYVLLAQEHLLTKLEIIVTFPKDFLHPFLCFLSSFHEAHCIKIKNPQTLVGCGSAGEPASG